MEDRGTPGTGPGHVDDGVADGTDGDTDRRIRVALVAGTAILVAIHLLLSARIGSPSVLFDEAGYLGNARWLAGNRNWIMPFSPAYSSGYSPLLAPWFALTGDPDLQWRGALAINAVLLASLLPLLYAVLRHVAGLEPRRALLGAAVGSVVPAALASGISAIAENLVLPLVPASVLALWAAAEPDRPRWQRGAFGPVVALLYATHPRFTVAVPIALVLLAVVAWDRRSRGVAAANAALLIALAAVAEVVNAAIVDARWRDVQRPEGGLEEWTDLATSGDGLRELALTALGQVWYLAAGSLGLVAIGLVLVTRAGTASATPRPTRLAAAWLLAAGTGVFATSVVFFAQNQFRVDHWVYGRHNDSFAPLLVAVAAVWLTSEVALRRRLAALGAAAALVAVGGAVLAAARDEATFDHLVSPFAVPALGRTLTNAASNGIGTATIAAVALIGGLAALVALGAAEPVRRRVPRTASALALVALIGWFGYVGLGVSTGTDRFSDYLDANWTAPAEVERLGVDHLAIDASVAQSRLVLNYPWALPDVRMDMYNAELHEVPPADHALTSLQDPDRPAAGDRIVLLDEGGLYEHIDAPEGIAIWVRPGPAADAYAEGGALLPDGFPTRLPDAAAHATVRIVDRPTEPVVVASGEAVPLTVEIVHEGTGAPWPDVDSYRPDGHVRIASRITPEDPDLPPGAPSGGELPWWMRPGDRATVPAEVYALDPFTAPLEPGRYRVELTLRQQGFDWEVAGGPDATFTMEVVAG
ncbi:MAG: hypothetical protein KDA97_01770 [Acidimicrobiales bacterium]|nr:hypothetical protein [Acidimicrobiales bacterium]